MKQIQTKVKRGGFCIQGTDYTCGPAAAVTALRQLGIHAEEGQIALLAHTSRYWGTPEDILYKTLKKLYSQKGLLCQYRPFDSLDQLKEAGLTIVVIKFKLLVDHYVTVLEVTEKRVIIADPLIGKIDMSHNEFREIWRFSGIVMKRDSKE